MVKPYLYQFLVGIILLSACAQINPLSGGPEDNYAPSLDSAKSYPIQGQTNFDGDRVELKFNEYISLVKPNDNIIITPRPSVAPIIESHNKTLKIYFQEPLLPNTTYTINFNRAITDITEKNDSIFQYVFSTGPFIDSLKIRGKVTDAFTNKPMSSFLVGLYPFSDTYGLDSVARKTKPQYIAQTTSNGDFELNYLRSGTYFLFAFSDKNRNFLLDADEDVAFLPEIITLDSPNTDFCRIKSFKQSNAKVSLRKLNFTAPGRVEVLFSLPIDSFQIETSLPLLEEPTGSRDSLVFWLADNPVPKMKFYAYYDTIADTLKPVYKAGNSDPVLMVKSNVQNGKLYPEQYLTLEFTEPVLLSQNNLAGLRVYASDSSLLDSNLWMQKSPRTWELKYHSEKPFFLELDSASIHSVYGRSNNSSLKFSAENFPANYYGELTINADTTYSYPAIVYLLDSKGIVVDTADFERTIVFEKVLPGEYQLRLVLDEDGNGQWTSGSLQEGRIPENVIYFNETIAVKSKWQLEIEWQLNGR